MDTLKKVYSEMDSIQLFKELLYRGMMFKGFITDTFIETYHFKNIAIGVLEYDDKQRKRNHTQIEHNDSILIKQKERLEELFFRLYDVSESIVLNFRMDEHLVLIDFDNYKLANEMEINELRKESKY